MVERSEREELLSYINDAFKDAHGFRPRGALWEHFTSLSVEELNEEADKLSTEIARQIKEEADIMAQNVITFEQKIADLIATGAGDRANALRWLFDAEGLLKEDLQWYGASFVEHHFNLPYGYLNEDFKKAS